MIFINVKPIFGRKEPTGKIKLAYFFPQYIFLKEYTISSDSPVFVLSKIGRCSFFLKYISAHPLQVNHIYLK